MRYRSTFVRLLLATALASMAARAEAQCDCDHTLALDDTVVDGDALGVMPGDRVCVEAGERPFLRLNHFTGTAAEPITVLNCGGVVRIHNTDRAYALVIEGESEFLHVTGTGDPASEHGFRISAPDTDPYPGIGVWIQGRATDIEVDHMEVFDTGFAGVMAKTDPGCDDRAAWPTFVQRNTHLHHLWVHDTGGEGFYVGSTQAMGYSRTCEGATVVIPPHRLDGVDIHHVLIEDTGWDGIQIGFARTECFFHDSVVHRVGLLGVEFQMQGLQIGNESSCEVRRNDLRDGPAMGIIVLESGDSLFADNVIARFAVNGIYANDRGMITSDWRIVHNTIALTGEAPVRVFSTGAGEATNNFVIGASDGSIEVPGAWPETTNVYAADVGAAGILGADDFHLGDTSVARGAGTDRTAVGFDRDLDGRGRAMPPSVGAYEHVGDAPDAGPVPDAGPRPDGGPRPDAGPRADGGAPTGAPETAGGCGCHVRRPHDGPALLVLLGVVLAARTRRRSVEREPRTRRS